MHLCIRLKIPTKNQRLGHQDRNDLGCLTHYYQLLDVSISKPLKDGLIKIYWISHRARRKQYKSISTRFNKLGCKVMACWQIINKSFKVSGITLNSDGREDKMLIAYNGLLGDYQKMI